MSSAKNAFIGRVSRFIASSGILITFILFVLSLIFTAHNIALLKLALVVAFILGVSGVSLGLVAGIRGEGRFGVLMSVILLVVAGVFMTYSMPVHDKSSPPVESPAE